LHAVENPHKLAFLFGVTGSTKMIKKWHLLHIDWIEEVLN